jgi:hypothetical protein
VRRCLAASSIAVALLVAAVAGAATSPIQAAARNVRSAIPAIEAYAADHGTYEGMTLAKLRAYDRSIGPVVVRRATRRGYCVQSTVKRAVAHFDGPAGAVRSGRCGVRGRVVPFPPRPSGDSETEPAAYKQLRWGAVLAVAYYADHNTYVGMTVEKLRRFDAAFDGVSIAWASAKQFCLEATDGAATYHLLGPAEGPKAGACPPAPG